MLIKGNRLNGTYKCYVLRNAKKWVSELPVRKREELIQKIEDGCVENVLRGLLPFKDKDILDAILGYLKGGEDDVHSSEA